jgi:hypothetical protein
MNIINPWNVVYENAEGEYDVTYDWQAGKEYLIHLSDLPGADEVITGHIRIPLGTVITPLVSGIAGMRTACGWDVAIAAEVLPAGRKRFVPVWGRSTVHDVIYRIMERDISPLASEWDLDPGDDTYEMVEYFNAGSSRTGVLTNFLRDYEYLFILNAPESSNRAYLSCATFYNFESLYAHSSVIISRGILYWSSRDWIQLTGLSESPTFNLIRGPNTHNIIKVYRRKINYDRDKAYYNSIPLVAELPRQKGTFTRYLDYGKEYIFGGLDYEHGNEICTGMMRFEQEFEKFLSPGAGFMVRLLDHIKLRYDSRSKRFSVIDQGELHCIHERLEVLEYVVPPPPPVDEPDPEDPVVSCEDQCLSLGQRYITEVNVEVIFDDPPDWQQRSYEYKWSAPSTELTIVSTSQNGRSAIFRLNHIMELEDNSALLAYDIGISVTDLQYTSAGVQDSDTAVLTFEMPCLQLDNETNFSINDVSVAECGPGDSNMVATFVVTSDVAIEGSEVSIDWISTGLTADEGTDFGTSPGGTIVFPEGSSSQSIDISVLCDSVAEFNETFEIRLSNVTRGTITKAVGTGTIVDDSPNELVVTLASEGDQFQNYILRDISGSMSVEDVTLNGNTSSRDAIAVSILNNYSIPSSDIVCASGANVTTFATLLRRHVLDNVSPSQKNVSVFFVTDSTDGYGTGASAFSTYTSPSTDHPAVFSHGAVNNQTGGVSLVPAVIVAAGDTWADVMGVFPSTIEDMKITVVRLVGPEAIGTQGSIDAEQGYNDLFTLRPSEISEASLETYDAYTTGEQGPLNDRIDASVLSTYNAYCTKSPENVIQVQASNEESARSLAESQLGCV